MKNRLEELDRHPTPAEAAPGEWDRAVEARELSSRGLRSGGARSLKRHGLTALRVVVSVGLILFLLRGVAPERVEAIARTSLSNWPLLVAALALPALGAVIVALRWRLLLGGLGAHAPLRTLVDAVLVGLFFNNFLPSTIGGDVMRGWWVRDAVGSAARSLTVVALDRLIGLIGFCAVGIAAAALVPSVVRDAPAFWIVVLGGGLGTAALALVTRPATLRRARSLLPAALLGRLRGKVEQVVDVLMSLRQAWARLALSFGLGVVLQLNVIAQFLLLAAALEVGIDLGTLAVLIPIVNLITLLPVSINGFGVREAALAALGGSFGLGVSEAVLLAYAWVFCSLVYSVVGGLIYLRGRAASPAAALLKERPRAPLGPVSTPAPDRPR